MNGLDRVVESLYQAPVGIEEPPTDDWPELAEEALHGPAGDFVQALEPHTEADPVAILVQYLVFFGSILGRDPHFTVEADRHTLNLFVALVGETAKGRKGTSLGHVRELFGAIDPDWCSTRIQDGLSSGEGLIWAVRNPTYKKEEIVDEGVFDKRLLLVEGELASTLRVLGRDGNTLSPILRNAWDRGDLRTLTKNSPAVATGAHISIIGHITRQELIRYLTSTEAGNGFGNRFMWLMVRRSKCLPEGGVFNEVDRAPFLRQLRAAVDFALEIGEIHNDPDSRKIWATVYPDLSEGKPGLLGAMIARSEAIVMRLASLYAVLDCSSLIRQEHMLAALALWQYAETSARFIFGDSLGDPIADEILTALRRASEGLSRDEIRNLFGRHKRSGEISAALKTLYDQGKAWPETIPTAGRSIERWRAK